jgi:hypothetical protein
MESMTNGKDNESVTAPEPAESDDTAVERQHWRPSRRTKIIGGAGALAVLVVSAGGILYRDKWNDDREAGRERDEVALLEELRDEGLPLRSDRVVLHAGVKVRDTPHTVSSNVWKRSNVDHGIGAGEVSVVSNPIRVDLDGVIWMGFTAEAPGDERRSIRQLAQDMFWVNLGALEIESEGREQPYVEYIETPSTELPTESTINGDIDRFGNVRLPDTENPAAVAVELEEWELEALGIAPNQE